MDVPADRVALRVERRAFRFGAPPVDLAGGPRYRWGESYTSARPSELPWHPPGECRLPDPRPRPAYHSPHRYLEWRAFGRLLLRWAAPSEAHQGPRRAADRHPDQRRLTRQSCLARAG